MNPIDPSEAPGESIANPFEPPRNGPKLARREWPANWRGLMLWVVLFAANLITPLMFAGYVLRNSEKGLLGMGIAILAWGMGGVVFLLAYPRFVAPAVAGAAAVAIWQLAPLLQMLAGALALRLVIGPTPRFATDCGVVGGFLITFLTGFELIAASLLIGIILRPLGRWAVAEPKPTAPPPRGPSPTTYPRLRPPP